MVNEKCIEHIHKMRNIMSEIYMRKAVHDDVGFQELDRLKHELEKLWVTCLNCSKGEICGNKEE